MDHPLINIIRQSVPVSPEEATLILAYFNKKMYQRNEIVLHAGDLAQEVFFVATGGLHLFYVDDDGNDRTCSFAFENEFITDLESFSKKLPATCFIQALSPCLCYTITCALLAELTEISPATKEFFRIVIENVAAESMRRNRSLQSASPEKAFTELLEQRPGIFQRVPQRMIAQYLGIAPESLSRIKKRIFLQAKS